MLAIRCEDVEMSYTQEQTLHCTVDSVSQFTSHKQGNKSLDSDSAVKRL